ncbi:hypothetical protein ACI65C_011604 [Semiaphis heraclei]
MYFDILVQKQPQQAYEKRSCKEDIVDRIKDDYWMGAEVRSRVTFNVNNPIVYQTKQILKAIAAELQMNPNAKLVQKRRNNFYGRKTGR